ncbi:CysB family HTH-type transcriptional regulator [Pelistega europaea]|uniref:CysB family HTH-type transcriptional regulator n=1 Tax=Pelistega europaea TaxID=106147 RepID=A0A7Y4LA75_9BURK|nr:CysB family HTH-type transcriptional regulator [Pelistega europaea]NOL49864.1 CysB family HTH-type transcriptional regulator [Pelistega europaea]
MNLQQFRYIRETIRRNFNLTETSHALYTSQPGVSKAIIEFEDELGLQIFRRHGKRIKGLTKPGQDVVAVIERIMREVDNLKRVSDDYAKQDEGELVIGCTHTQARYFLPEIILKFKKKFPKVRVSLAEGNPTQLANMVLAEEADVAMATETLSQVSGLATFPCYEWSHTVVVKPDHPLTELTSSQARNISLEQIAAYPIITYEKAFSGRKAIDASFEAAGVHPDIILEAIDADVIKTYVEVDLGVGIIAGMAFNPRRDPNLVGIPVGHLFGKHISRLGVRKGIFARDYLYEFIQMCAPGYNREKIDEALIETTAE